MRTTGACDDSPISAASPCSSYGRACEPLYAPLLYFLLYDVRVVYCFWADRDMAMAHGGYTGTSICLHLAAISQIVPDCATRRLPGSRMTVRITVTLDEAQQLPGKAGEQSWEELLRLITSKKDEEELALQVGDRRLPVKDLRVRARPWMWLKRPWMWLKRCAMTVWHNEVYDEYQPHAEGIKAILQILTGIAFAAFLAYQIVTDLNKISLQDSVDYALKTVGAALAVSAVIELVYTFFTDGPDEALDPLILGISSFTLIKLSPNGVNLKTADVLPVSLLALAIFILFFARRFLCEVKKGNRKVVSHEGDQVQQSDPSTSTEASRSV